MPEKITKLKSGKYKVKTPGGVKSKGTTLRNAMAQARLLRAVEHGWKPTKKKAKGIEKAKTMRIHY
jgi:ribosomal protein S6E (S10)